MVHRSKNTPNLLLELLRSRSKRPVIEVEHYDKLSNGKIYVAPANYHLLIGADLHFELDFSEKVLFSRPSIDVSLCSFAKAFKEKLVAVVLSGSNQDCAKGCHTVLHFGGKVIVQDPSDAEVNIMPLKTLQYNPTITTKTPTKQLMKTMETLTVF